MNTVPGNADIVELLARTAWDRWRQLYRERIGKTPTTPDWSSMPWDDLPADHHLARGFRADAELVVTTLAAAGLLARTDPPPGWSRLRDFAADVAEFGMRADLHPTRDPHDPNQIDRFLHNVDRDLRTRARAALHGGDPGCDGDA